MSQKIIPIVPAQDIDEHLYAKRQKIYPREVHGIFANFRVAAALILLGLFYGLPWFQWSGRQAVLFDLPARKFHIFSLTFWPQDFIYLTLLLILAALSLFFFTTLAGRLWCGYACPQTVWTETFLWIERMVEGSRTQQIRLDKNSRSRKTIVRKAIKHTLWILFALWTGFTFVGYFTPIRELTLAVVTLSLSGWALFWVLFYSFATYGNAGWMREQVCLYMCPYARFQSAMFDKDTLIISYDQTRGEPRGKTRSAETDDKEKGDCIDCTLCVQVCPTGIDIRKGLQYECIGCAACIDACDEVMEKIQRPKGLIRYTTENALAGKSTHILRPRPILYALVLITLFSALLWNIGQRNEVEIDVIGDRSRLYRELNDGTITNSYTINILNKTEQSQTYELSVSGIDGIKLISDEPVIDVQPGAVRGVGVTLQVHYTKLKSSANDVTLRIRSLNVPGIESRKSTRFLGPDIEPPAS